MRVPHNMSDAVMRKNGESIISADGRLFQTSSHLPNILSTSSTVRLQPVNATGQRWLFRKGTQVNFKSCLMILASLGFAALLLGSSPALAQRPSLGSAQSFAVLGASTVTSTGLSTITGDLGVSPGTAVTGFPPGTMTGTRHAGDTVALQAQSDVTKAYNACAGAACTLALTGQDLGGRTLTPGVYCFAASAPLNGVLTLDALGDPKAVFIFQIGSTLLPAINSSVKLINGAQDANVFWQVGSSATLAAGVDFKGNIIALASITLSKGTKVSGRALARTAAVTMDTSSVSTQALALSSR